MNIPYKIETYSGFIQLFGKFIIINYTNILWRMYEYTTCSKGLPIVIS